MESEKKRIRGNNYTSNEKMLLLNIAQKYHFIIHSKKLDHTTLHRKSAAWKKITDEFNAISISSPNIPNKIDRTEESLRKFYGYIKKKKRNDDNTMDKFAADGIIVHTNSNFNMGLENSFEINTTKYSDEAKELLEKNINQIHKELDSIQTHSNKTRHRTSNYTVNERILLLKLIKEYQPIIDNKKNDNATIKRKSDAWAKIVEKFNDFSQHKIIRTEESLRKYYENIKKKYRKQDTDSFPDFDQKTVTFEDDIYNLSVKSEEKSVAGSEYFDNGAMISEESYHSIELNSIDSDETRNENCNYTVHEKILLLHLTKKYQQFIDEDTDQTVDAWNAITDQFNAMVFPNKFVRKADSLRMIYENVKNKSQTEEDNENTHECPIHQEESAINNILRLRPFESDTNILEESIEFENVDDLNTKIEKTSSLVPAKNNNKLTDLKIELYQLKNKSITLDNEIKHQQLLQERIKTRILELDLEKASEK